MQLARSVALRLATISTAALHLLFIDYSQQNQKFFKQRTNPSQIVSLS